MGRGAMLAAALPTLPTLPTLAAVAAVVALTACASGRARPAAYPDAYVRRLQALALIQTLNANILSSTSATLTLEAWCRDHQLAAPARITATRVGGVERPATAEQRARLGVGDAEPIKYRHVQLRCGDRVLSEADNWYVPGRLTPEMNRLLDTTDTPFGRAVQPLAPYRRTLNARMLWTPLPDGWERDPRPAAATAAGAATLGGMTIPDALFEHRAVLYTREHIPFSEVHEIYQRDLLAFLAAAGSGSPVPATLSEGRIDMSPLDRFKRAQDEPYAGFEPALKEIRSGRKRGHWIWYLFPQLDGLGMSPMARDYAIEDEAEAAAYLRDPQLRERLLAITQAVAEQLTAGGSASGSQTLRLSTLMGSEIDAKKLVSSLTLFGEVARRLAAEDRRGEDVSAYTSLAGTAGEILSIASAQGYPPCAFTRRALSMTD